MDRPDAGFFVGFDRGAEGERTDERVPPMNWISGPDGARTFLSKAWYDFTGQPGGGGLGRGWIDAVYPDDRAVAEEIGRASCRERVLDHV